MSPLRGSPAAVAVRGHVVRGERAPVVEVVSPGGFVPVVAEEEWAVLQLVLVGLQADGVVTPCQADPGLWFASRLEELEVAADGCGYCPVLAPCRAYADAAGEGRHGGVWGGRLPARRRSPSRRRAALAGAGR